MTVQLSAQDKALIETDFGEEIEKMAAARVEAVSEAYDYGFAKLAAEVADAHDKAKEEEEKEEKKEDKMDEESEKAAAELGAFIERGFFDGLRKLGAERHQDELYYIAPYILQKVAAVSEETKQDPHTIRRVLLGNALSSGIAAPWGRKMEAMGQASGHAQGESLVGAGIGGATGAGLGAGIGALASKGARGAGAGKAALLGLGAGALLGGMAGGLKGNFDRRATEIHREAYDKK